MKSKFFKRKVSMPTQAAPPTPRAMDAINKEYSNLCAQAGDVVYKLKRFEESLADLKVRMSQVDAEAGARRKLDEEAAKQAKPQENTDVQS